MAVALVQATNTAPGSNTNPITVTYGSTTTTGNLLVCVVMMNVNTVSGVTDNKSNTWTLLRSLVNYNGSYSQYIYYCANATGGASHTVSVATSSTGWNGFVAIHEFSGAATSSPIESATATSSITSNATATSPTSGAPITTTNANDYVMGIFDANTTTTYSAATGWAMLNTATASNTFATVGAAQTTATTYTPQVLSAITSWSEKAWSLAIIPAGVGGATAHNFMLLGVGQ